MAEIDRPIWPDVICRIARLVKQAGGRPMVVGGTVLDLIEDKDPQDWDIEVFGLSMESLEIILEDFNPQTCGQHFGIVKIHADGIDIDVGVPRRDNSTGKGHRDFYDSFDPGQYNISASQMAPYKAYYDELTTISQRLDEGAAARLLARGGF